MNDLETGNLFRGLPRYAAEELFSDLRSAPGLRIERIVSTGQATPGGEWYDQDTHEWVVLLKGRARLAFEDRAGETEMAPGDYLLISAHCRHRIEWTAPDEATVWLAVHFTDGGIR